MQRTRTSDRRATVPVTRTWADGLYLHFAEAGLVVMAPGKASSSFLSLQRLLHLFGSEEHLNVDQVLRNPGQTNRNSGLHFTIRLGGIN